MRLFSIRNSVSMAIFFTLLCGAIISPLQGMISSPKTTQPSLKKPRVSIITSVYNGDSFIEGFLSNITKLSIFPEAELIIINANSPGNEEGIIKAYCQKYLNIHYFKLLEDPGLYSVWNQGIPLAQADLITNANIDDRRNLNALALHVDFLEQHPEIDLVYSDCFVTEVPGKLYEACGFEDVYVREEYEPQELIECLAGPMPTWRKSLHDRYGFFDTTFKSAGDWDLWARAASQGARFKKLYDIAGVYYYNPEGLSSPSNRKKKQRHDAEVQRVVKTYRHLWKKKPSKAISADLSDAD